MIIPIRPAVMHYPWGSIDGAAKLFGQKVEGAEPVAELWYGAHAKAPSEIPSRWTDGECRDLRCLLQAKATSVLGEELTAQFGSELPFLLKVLSAANGLSIQAHPSLEQAEEGYRRENLQGIAVDAANRNYRDPNHKPECMLAAERFWALSGFRPPDEIADDMAHLVERTELPLAKALLAALGTEPNSRRLEDFYRLLLSADEHRVLEFVNRVVELARARTATYVFQDSAANEGLPDAEPPEDSRLWRWYWIAELARQFPGDSGVVAPLYLNVLRLEAGQALFMTSGILHAYLRGTGYEIMANSDNVLRAGCTGKHVDKRELLRVLRFSDAPPTLVAADSTGWYRSLAPEFQIALFDGQKKQVPVGSGELCLREDCSLGRRPALLLVQRGVIRIIDDADLPGKAIELGPGDAVFISIDTKPRLSFVDDSEAVFVLASVNAQGERP